MLLREGIMQLLVLFWTVLQFLVLAADTTRINTMIQNERPKTAPVRTPVHIPSFQGSLTKMRCLDLFIFTILLIMVLKSILPSSLLCTEEHLKFLPSSSLENVMFAVLIVVWVCPSDAVVISLEFDSGTFDSPMDQDSSTTGFALLATQITVTASPSLTSRISPCPPGRESCAGVTTSTL